MRAMLRRLTRAACISVHAPDGSHSYVAIFFILVLPNTPDGHTDRSDWQVSHRALTHGPADDTPRESVNDDGEVQPALVGVLLRHIGHPQLIGPLCSKRPLYEVWSGRTSRVSVRDPFRAPAADAFDAKLSHEAS